MILYLAPILYFLPFVMPFLLLGAPGDYFELIEVIKKFILFAVILVAARLIKGVSKIHFGPTVAAPPSKAANFFFIIKLLVLVGAMLVGLQILRVDCSENIFFLILLALGLSGAYAALEARGLFLLGVFINLAQFILASQILYLLRHQSPVWQTAIVAGLTGAAIAGWESAKVLARTSRKPTASGRALEIEDKRPYSKAFVMVNRGLVLLPIACIGGLVILGQVSDWALLCFLPVLAIPKLQPMLPTPGQSEITLPERFLEQVLAVYALPGLIFCGVSLLLQ